MPPRTSMMAGVAFSVATWLTIYGSAMAMYGVASWYTSHPVLLLFGSTGVGLIPLTWGTTRVVRTWRLAPTWFY